MWHYLNVCEHDVNTDAKQCTQDKLSESIMNNALIQLTGKSKEAYEPNNNFENEEKYSSSMVFKARVVSLVFKIVSVIPFILSFKTINLINGWYFYIPVVWIMYINWLSFIKPWMGIVDREDFSIWVKTSGILIIFFIISLIAHNI